MRTGIWPVLGIAALLAMSGCAANEYCDAAEKARTQNPHAALEYLRVCLAEHPNNERAKDLVRDIAGRVADEHRERVESLGKAGKYDDAVSQCDRMLASEKLISDMPGNMQLAHEADERPRFAKLAAKKFYEAGVKLEGEKHAKEAAIAFRRALGFRANYEDALARYQKNQAGALVKIAIMRFECSAPQGLSLTQTLERGTIASCMAKNPEFLRLVSANDADDATGKLTGNIQTANFTDTDWVAHPGHRSTTKSVRGDDGRYYDVEISGSWTIYERATNFDLTVSYNVVDASGTAIGGSTVSKHAGDAKKYVETSGDEQAIPDDVKSLPRGAAEPLGRNELSATCANQAAEELGLSLFKQFK